MTSDRAVSATLTYVLTLTIVTMLISGLFIGSSSFVESQRDRAIRSEFDVIGHRLAADITAADRLVRTSQETVTIDETLPAGVANTPYRITVSDSPTGTGLHDVELTFSTSSPQINVTVSLRTHTPVADTTVPGGDVVIEYDPGSGELVIDDG